MPEDILSVIPKIIHTDVEQSMPAEMGSWDSLIDLKGRFAALCDVGQMHNVVGEIHF